VVAGHLAVRVADGDPDEAGVPDEDLVDQQPFAGRAPCPLLDPHPERAEPQLRVAHEGEQGGRVRDAAARQGGQFRTSRAGARLDGCL